MIRTFFFCDSCCQEPTSPLAWWDTLSDFEQACLLELLEGFRGKLILLAVIRDEELQFAPVVVFDVLYAEFKDLFLDGRPVFHRHFQTLSSLKFISILAGQG